jgi:hypothetical protein
VADIKEGINEARRRNGFMNEILNTHFDFFFRIRTVHLDIIKLFYSPTDAQMNCLKNKNKICINTAPT